MSWIVNVGIGLLILPTLLIVIIPLIDQVFSISFIDGFSSVLSYLNGLIGSNNVNFLLVVFSLIMFLCVFRRILRVVGLVK